MPNWIEIREEFGRFIRMYFLLDVVISAIKPLSKSGVVNDKSM